MSRFMKIGGEDGAGTARSLHVSDENILSVGLDGIKETVIRDEVVVGGGGSEQINVPILKPYRLFVRLHDNVDSSWHMYYRPSINGMVVDERGQERLLQSDGENIIHGYGARGSGFSDVIIPQGSRTVFNLHNNSNTSTTFSVVLIEYSNITFSGKNKYPQNIALRFMDSIPSQETKSLTTTNSSSAIDFLEFSTDGDCQIEVIYGGEEGSTDYRALGTVRPDGGGFAGIRPSSIANNGSGIFEIVDHNTNTNTFKCRINRTLEFPGGFSIRVKNFSTEEQNFAMRIFGRELNHD